MNMVRANRIDLAIQHGVPETLPVCRLPQRRIDFCSVAASPIDIMGQVMRAGLDVDFRSCGPVAKGRLQRLCR
jgi:hypothetical protein